MFAGYCRKVTIWWNVFHKLSLEPVCVILWSGCYALSLVFPFYFSRCILLWRSHRAARDVAYSQGETMFIGRWNYVQWGCKVKVGGSFPPCLAEVSEQENWETAIPNLSHQIFMPYLTVEFSILAVTEHLYLVVDLRYSTKVYRALQRVACITLWCRSRSMSASLSLQRGAYWASAKWLKCKCKMSNNESEFFFLWNLPLFPFKYSI
jgi:hypothetical protein